MFDDMVERTDTRGKTKKPLTIFLSAVFQVAFLAVLLLIPLIYTEALPKTMMATLLVAPPPLPPPPPPPPPVQVVKIKPVAHLIQAGKLVAPKAIPKEVKIIKEEAEPPDMGNVGVTGGVPGGVPGGQAAGVGPGVLVRLTALRSPIKRTAFANILKEQTNGIHSLCLWGPFPAGQRTDGHPQPLDLDGA